VCAPVRQQSMDVVDALTQCDLTPGCVIEIHGMSDEGADCDWYGVILETASDNVIVRYVDRTDDCNVYQLTSDEYSFPIDSIKAISDPQLETLEAQLSFLLGDVVSLRAKDDDVDSDDNSYASDETDDDDEDDDDEDDDDEDDDDGDDDDEDGDDEDDDDGGDEEEADGDEKSDIEAK